MVQVEAKCHPLPVRPSRVGWLLRSIVGYGAELVLRTFHGWQSALAEESTSNSPVRASIKVVIWSTPCRTPASKIETVCSSVAALPLTAGDMIMLCNLTAFFCGSFILVQCCCNQQARQRSDWRSIHRQAVEQPWWLSSLPLVSQ